MKISSTSISCPAALSLPDEKLRSLYSHIEAPFLETSGQVTLATHQVLGQIIDRIPVSPDKAQTELRLYRLLEKPCYCHLFSPSDKRHLLEIYSSCTPAPTDKDEKNFAYYFQIIKESIGEEIFFFISNPKSYQGCSLQQIIRLLQLLTELAADIDELIPVLLQFESQEITLKVCCDKIEECQRQIEAKKYPEKNLDEVIRAFLDTGPNSLVSTPLQQDELDLLKQDYLRISEIGQEIKSLGIDVLTKQVAEIQEKWKNTAETREERLRLFAISREVIRLKFGIFPYNTQMLVILGLLNFPDRLKGRIAQVRTGEGKSTIVTLLAFYFACQGKACDIISSSRYLAKRDCEKYADFFALFGISTSHLCTDEPNSENFKGQIIYGTNYDFEFALMRYKLGHQNNRLLMKVAIVDEVDNLFLDSALDSARIAIDGRNELSWIYPPILAYVQENRIKGKMNSAEDLKERLCNYQQGRFKDIASGFELDKLETWIKSAVQAAFVYKIDVDYVIKPVEVPTANGLVYKNSVVIVDKENTGRLKEKSRWQNGEHEFVEAINGLPIEEEGLMPASLCHPVFFRQYDSIFGLTGTMGKEIERKEIGEIYRVDTFDAPPHKPCNRTVLDPKICSSQEELFRNLLDEIKTMQKAKRPTLVVFETIEDTEKFATYLKDKGLFPQLLNERQAAHEDFVVAQAGAPGAVTIATNAAGRGTDIILHPLSLQNRGLHMIFAFFPKNDRVQNQGIGRAGRQGQPGSARLMIQQHPMIAHLGIEFLIDQRANKIERESKHRILKGQIESINYDYLHKFFEQSQVWQQKINKNFMAATSQLVEAKANALTSALTPDSVPLDKTKAALRKTFLFQATNRNASHFWSAYIQSVRYSLQTHIQQEWAEYFYDRLDDLYAKCHHTNKQHSEVIDEYKLLIEKQYQANSNFWERFLIEPEQGFYNYLEEVVGKLQMD